MELHHRSCVLPSNAPALPDPADTIPSRVLQERSGNRGHGYVDGSTSWKRSSSASPVENLYSQSLGSNYFTGNIAAQLNGEKSEEQIEFEAKRLWKLLQTCEKYQKYRDRQPTNAKEREQKWPDQLERAFFRGKNPFSHSHNIVS
jgi:transcriptional enhancer factor